MNLKTDIVGYIFLFFLLQRNLYKISTSLMYNMRISRIYALYCFAT